MPTCTMSDHFPDFFLETKRKTSGKSVKFDPLNQISLYTTADYFNHSNTDWLHCSVLYERKDL